MRLPGLSLGAPVALVGGARAAPRAPVAVPGAAARPRRSRVVRVDPLTVAIRARGVDVVSAEDYRRRLVAVLEARPEVAWARVNALVSAVVVGFVDEAAAARADELGRLVVELEAAEAPAGPRHPVDRPGDVAPVVRAGAILGAEVAAAALSVTGRLLRWVRLPHEVAAVVTFVDTQPRLRGALERRVGRPRTDELVGFSSALAHGLSQGAVGLAVDTAARTSRLLEERARLAAWRKARARLLSSPERAGAEPLVVERPVPPPIGPIERYADRASLVAFAGAGVTALATANPRRALNVGLAALPKAAPMGREGFCGQLSRLLARRGAVVLDPLALRRLDRVDTVVFDCRALSDGRFVVAKVVPLDPGLPAEQVEELTLAVHALFAARAPEDVATRDGWQLGPVDRLDLRGRRGARQRRELEPARVLGLARGRRLEALVAVVPEPPQALDGLVAAGRRGGLRLVLANWSHDAQRWGPDEVLPSGASLVAGIRALQADGAGVLLVSSDGPSLAAADVAVGVTPAQAPPPWGAHILLDGGGEPDYGTAVLLVEAAAAARRVSQRSVRLAQAGTGIATVMATTGVAGRASRQSVNAVNGAGAVALGYGLWAAAELGRTPPMPPVSHTPWHALPVSAVLDELRTRPSGLTEDEARRRRARLPAGTIDPVGAAPNLLRAFSEELANPLTPILAGGAALSAAVGSVLDAVIVLGVSALSALIGGVQRHATDRAVAELLAASVITARVRRGEGDAASDATEARIPAHQLVPGDVVLLAPGDVVPADCRVLEAVGLEVDESSLTGESLPVAKHVTPVASTQLAERTSMVYEGTTVAAGRGSAVVVAVGAATEAGRSAAVSRTAPQAAGVEARLAQITNITLPITLASAAAVVGAGLLRARPVRDTISGGVGLAVAAVPEGLPFLVSAAQLAAARRLSQRGALVRNPRTIEALGRADVLCFDKTGTLTEGRIRLTRVCDGRRTGESTDPAVCSDEVFRRLLAAALRATPERRGRQKLAHLTDRAVAAGASDGGVDRAEGARGWRRLAALPFEPSRGYHATLGEVRPTDAAEPVAVLSVKGAPEVVLPRCGDWISQKGRVELTGKRRQRLARELDRLARQGLRVLAVAERTMPVPAQGAAQLHDDDVSELTFLGFVALSDPVRVGAAPSLAELRDAGVQIVMITGDHPATAAAVARQLDVLPGGSADGAVLTGQQIDAMTDAQLEDALGALRVVARGTPAHKMRVVTAFQARKRTVAMTGDGANDAPAIRLADVGIALGRHGTPAARAAADLVVTDDRLETIISALVEGRAMWASVRDALGILVGGNLGEIAFTVFGSALTGRSPLTARQLLLVNLLTDLAPATAVALRRPEVEARAELLHEGPEASLGFALTRDITLRATVTAAGAGAAWLIGRGTGRPARARTIGLAALVGTQLGQTLLLGGHDPLVVVSSLGSIAALAAVIQTPVVSQFFGCVPMGPVAWATAGSVAATATVVGLVLDRVAQRLPLEEWTQRAATAARSAVPVGRRDVGLDRVMATRSRLGKLVDELTDEVANRMLPPSGAAAPIGG